MNSTTTTHAGLVHATRTLTRGLPIIAAAIFGLSLLPAFAHTQDVPGSRIEPSQVDHALGQAIRSFSVDMGWDYAGDCAVNQPGSNQLCGEVYVTDDGAVYVELVDADDIAEFQLGAIPLSHGAWRLSGDIVPAD
jgi:hypothetical protein